MTKVFVIPYELNDNNVAVFKIIEGIKKDTLISMKLNDIDYHFVNELFEEAEKDFDIETPILKLDLVEQTILSEVE